MAKATGHGATHGSAHGGGNDHDLEAHRESWAGFVRVATYATIVIVCVLAWMALFLTP